MIWLTWRLQRTDLALLGAVLLALAALLLLTHADVVAEYKSLTAPDCTGADGFMTPQCFAQTGSLYKVVNNMMAFFNFLPLLAALLVALPIVSELDTGTYRLAWTQSITRGRWAGFKFGGAILSALLFAGIFAASFHWWSSPLDKFDGRLAGDQYEFLGTLPVAYTLFAVGLMLAVGTIARKPVLAIALASVAFIAIRITFASLVRDRLVSPVEAETQTFAPMLSNTQYTVDEYWRDAAGNRMSEMNFFDLCAVNRPDVSTVQRCVEANGLAHYTQYHPESHFWPLQLIETAIFLGGAAALIGFAAWYLLRRIE